MTIADKGGAEGGVRQMMTIDDEGEDCLCLFDVLCGSRRLQCSAGGFCFPSYRVGAAAQWAG